MRNKATLVIIFFVITIIGMIHAEDLSSVYSSSSLGVSSDEGAVRQIKGDKIEKLTSKMTATFQGSSVSDVFKAFALQTGLNIMVSPEIDAEVTASFTDATIKDAFLAILSANNLYYVESGTIIKILTEDEYMSELKKNFLETRTYDASIIDLDNLATVIKPFLTPDIGSMIVDEQSSRIIVTDVEDNFEKIDEIFDTVSTLPPMVEIETKIIQIDVSDGSEVGVRWDLLNIGDVLDMGFIFSSADGVSDEVMNLNASHTFNDSTFTVNALISALAEDNDVTIVSSPSVLAVNRETSWIHIGSKVPYIQSVVETSTTGITTSQVEFTDVGIKLTVTPVVSEDGYVLLEIEANNSSYTMEAITATENAPRIITTELESDAVVKDGETIIIGGLIQTEKTYDVKAVPILGQIPILKYLFSHTTEEEKRTELVIFLTPHIIRNGESNISEGRLSASMLEAAGLTNVIETATNE